MFEYRSFYYRCYHCSKESVSPFPGRGKRALTVTKHSRQEYLDIVNAHLRTDGSEENSVREDQDNFIWRCPHCLTYVLAEKLERGEVFEHTKHFRFESYCLDDERNDFPEPEFFDSMIHSVLKEKKHPKYSAIFSPYGALKAMSKSEFQDNEEILYRLRIHYWRLMNDDNISIRNSDSISKSIYERLISDWQQKTDERYLFLAEIHRNMSNFEETLKLLTQPEEQYKDIISKYPKWVKMMIALAELKVPVVLRVDFTYTAIS